jgi:hypothetical protein
MSSTFPGVFLFKLGILRIIGLLIYMKDRNPHGIQRLTREGRQLGTRGLIYPFLNPRVV